MLELLFLLILGILMLFKPELLWKIEHMFTVKNGERTQKFNKCDHGYILDLGWCQAGDVVSEGYSSL